jgi:hypothetical protein
VVLLLKIIPQTVNLQTAAELGVMAKQILVCAILEVLKAKPLIFKVRAVKE